MVDGAVAEAVSEYNFGSSTLTLEAISKPGVKCGKVSKKIIQRRDKRRIRHAKLKNSLKFKAYRKKLQMIKSYREMKIREKEGQTYGAGEF